MVTTREDAVTTDKAKAKSHGDQDGFFIFGPGAVCVGSLLEMSRAAKELGLSMAEEQQHTAVIQAQIANDTAATIVRGGQKESEAMKDQAIGMLTSAGLTLIGSVVTFAHGNLSGREERADVINAEKVTSDMNKEPLAYHGPEGGETSDFDPAEGKPGLAELRDQLAGRRLFTKETVIVNGKPIEVKRTPREGLASKFKVKGPNGEENEYSLKDIMEAARTPEEFDALKAKPGKYLKQKMQDQNATVNARQTTATLISSVANTLGSVATGTATVYQADATQDKAKANADQAVLSADSEFVRSAMSGEAASTQAGYEGLKDSLLALRDIGRGMSA